jgi:hypothetical protein
MSHTHLDGEVCKRCKDSLRSRPLVAVGGVGGADGDGDAAIAARFDHPRQALIHGQQSQ